jgi:hypothetical protein
LHGLFPPFLLQSILLLEVRPELSQLAESTDFDK